MKLYYKLETSYPMDIPVLRKPCSGGIIQRSINILINGPILQKKANDFAKLIGKTDIFI